MTFGSKYGIERGIERLRRKPDIGIVAPAQLRRSALRDRKWEEQAVEIADLH